MTVRLSKLAQYLYSDNPEMAIQLHRNNRYQLPPEPQDVLLLLAKAYYISDQYERSIDILKSIQDSPNISMCYQTRMLLFKASYLANLSTVAILDHLRQRVQREVKDNIAVKRLINNITELMAISLKNSTTRSNFLNKTQTLTGERQEFEELFRAEDDHSIVMEGMPMFLISAKWFEAWQEFTSPSQRITREKKHPGPITQFQILQHPFDFFYDENQAKQYTNRYIMNGTRYKILPKKCWHFLKDKYTGTDIKRFNISFVDKPYDIMTEVFLKKIQIARYIDKSDLSFVTVQITRKENWEGVKTKLGRVWGPGNIYQYNNKKVGTRVNDSQILQQVDTVEKQYVFMMENKKEEKEKEEKCGNKECGKTKDLRWCQCKTIKYCGMDCLKANWKNHKKKCELQMSHQRQQGAVFKNFKLEEKQYGGKRGLVGLKNLGNTCYMNSGLQCLSNTREITEYFMKDEFKGHINYNNPLGTKGNIACAYAELIREMWTGNSEVLSPFKLKKMIGNFAAQFAGYGQQDSQQLISYLIDGLQQDLNLVKHKQNFQASDEIKPDEEMSRQSEFNYSKRISSYIRNLMAGQFKSTVVCSSCDKVSVCFDPYLLVSLPIPANQQWSLFFVPSDLTRGAIRFEFDYSLATTTLATLSKQLTKAINGKLDYTKKDPVRQDRLLYVIIHSEKFQLVKTLEGNELLSNLKGSDYLFCLQIPSTSDEQILLAEFLYKTERISFPRFLKFPKKTNVSQKEALIIKAIERGVDKYQKLNYNQLVQTQKLFQSRPFKILHICCLKKIKLLTYSESYKQNFRGKLYEMEEKALSIDDCLRNFAVKEQLEKQNSWYCNRCKDFKPAVKQMQIYKGNQILVLAFKRFTRFRKIRTPIKFPLDGLNMGPYFLSNKSNQSIFYDIYGVVNHYGSLGGGHYTAFCQNFLNKRWYEFNDSHVQQIKRGDIVTGDSYVLFLRKRD